MSILQCDENALFRQLEGLPSQLRVAFARTARSDRYQPSFSAKQLEMERRNVWFALCVTSGMTSKDDPSPKAS